MDLLCFVYRTFFILTESAKNYVQKIIDRTINVEKKFKANGSAIIIISFHVLKADPAFIPEN